VQVEADCSLPGHPEVFVVGDLMALDKLPGVAEVAMQSGIHAAQAIKRRIKGETESRPFRYRDLGSMATVARFRAVVSFKLKQGDTITVTVLDARGDPVTELASGRSAAAGVLERFKWDGRDADGRRVTDGRYRFRVALQREGRSVRLGKSTRLDVTPPRPLVTAIGPAVPLATVVATPRPVTSSALRCSVRGARPCGARPPARR